MRAAVTGAAPGAPTCAPTTARSGCTSNGGLAEYVSSPAGICLVGSRRPLTDDAAAIAQPLAVALHAVRRSGLRAGQSCAVIGVGGIGAFIVAAAAAAGASPLIALDIDEDRLQTARTLGAATVIDARGRELDAADPPGHRGRGCRCRHRGVGHRRRAGGGDAGGPARGPRAHRRVAGGPARARPALAHRARGGDRDDARPRLRCRSARGARAAGAQRAGARRHRPGDRPR